jgi:hypothetical protein
MGETRDRTIAELRKKLGREPTGEEVHAARQAVIRRSYADMAMTAAMLLDEGSQAQEDAMTGNPPDALGPTKVRGTH